MNLQKAILRWLPKKKQIKQHFLYGILGKYISAADLWRIDRRSLARGVALGLFIAFTPTIPFQMILTCLGAFYFRVNLPVGLAACWVTNPLTAMPIYLAAWRVGRRVISSLPFVAEFAAAYQSDSGVSRLMIHSLYLWSGSLIFGGAAALISNLLVRWLWKEGEDQHILDEKLTDKIKTWFDGYVGGFYGDDEYLNANIKLKEVHSRRVCGEMLCLADDLALSDNQKATADIIGLLHDVGRFKQFAEYRTYNDTKSVNHCLLGLEVLRQTNILADLDAEERQIIEKAVEYHGLKKLPGDLTGPTLLFARMIRDADKLDVFRVIIEYQELYERDPENFKLEIDLADEPWCSPEVVEAILNGQLIDYARLQTLNDMRLMQLGWVYDVNFRPTLKRISERKFVDKLLTCLPQTEQILRVKEKIETYVDSRLRDEA